DMLGNMSEVGAAAHRVDEPAWPPRGAVVLVQSGQQLEQALGEARQVCGLLAGQPFELDPREAHRLGTEDVRAAEVADVFKPHVRSLRLVSSPAASQAQYRACAGPMAGDRAARSNTHPAGSRCRRTSNRVIWSLSEAAWT